MNDLKFSRLDHALGEFLAQRSQLNDQQKTEFAELVATLNLQLSNGHTCIKVNAEQQALLQASGLVSSEQQTPLILEHDRLYFHRYWFYEKRLAKHILILARRRKTWPDLSEKLARYFPDVSAEVDWQRLAVARSLNLSFSIITGGPGTGKTTTVVKLLALLLELTELDFSIALVAPTGKAAMRLQESVVQNKQSLPCSDDIKQCIPETATTLHRLLGARSPSPYFTHDADKPLPYDLVVVDEASMVDLPLMSKLFDALNDHASIILLGDKDQLASVESGSVLADMTQSLPNHAQVLKTAFRFKQQIKSLADAVNQQNAEQAWALLTEQKTDHVAVLEQPLIDTIVEQQKVYWQLLNEGADFTEIIQCFNRFQVLCVNRKGANSVSNINYRLEQGLELNQAWYPGRPVMVNRNNPAMQLFNGDIGICLREQQDQRLMVYFQRPDGNIKKVLPARLTACETVFAMTIHKSQGSEFEQVLIVLPDQVNSILTKELIYTAITRARESVKVFAGRDIFIAGVKQELVRLGGLAQRLNA